MEAEQCCQRQPKPNSTTPQSQHQGMALKLIGDIAVAGADDMHDLDRVAVNSEPGTRREDDDGYGGGTDEQDHSRGNQAD